jgi:hypothetical protein
MGTSQPLQCHDLHLVSASTSVERFGKDLLVHGPA